MFKKNGGKKLISCIISFVFCFGLFNNVILDAYADASENVSKYDFEDGTTQGWFANGGDPAKVEVSSEIKHDSDYSLKVASRNQFWNTPTLDISSKVKAGDTVKFSAWVYFDSEKLDSKNFNLTFNFIDNGTEDWQQLDGADHISVPKKTWTKLEGTYVISDTAALTKFNAYIEIPEENGSVEIEDFYVDDIEITTPGTASGTVVEDSSVTNIVNSDYEDGTTQGWDGNGATIASVTEDAHSGASSFKISGRSNFWENPVYDLMTEAKNGETYTVSLWVKQNDTKDRMTNITFYKKDANGDNYTQASDCLKVSVKSGEWTKLEGTYTLDYTGTLEAFTVYVDLPEENQYDESYVDGIACIDYYIDDVTISVPKEASGMSTNFEDNTVQDWYTDGSEGNKLEVTDKEAHDGTYSLVNTGRTAFSDVPKYDLKDKLVDGTTYTMTAYVKIADAGVDGPSTRKINMTVYKNDDGVELYTQPEGAFLTETKVGEWTKVQGTYKFNCSENLDKLYMYLEIANENPYIAQAYNEDCPIVDMYIDDVTVVDNSNQPINFEPDIKGLYTAFDFPIGAAIEPYQLDDDDHVNLLTKHFNQIVAENCMKVEAIEPEEGVFDFTAADKLVDFAKANNMSVRGHNLLWYQAIPSWMFYRQDGVTPLDPNNAEDKALVKSRMENHINETLNHFIEKYGDSSPIYCWDVVNEVVREDGGLRTVDNPDNKSFPWLEFLGEDYIEDAFRTAHAADPNVQLFINDYSLDNAGKGQGLYDLVKKLKDKGVPIDGVGYQAHININGPSVETMQSVIEKYASLGVEVEITELDISTNGLADDQTMLKEAYRYKELFDMFSKEYKLGNLGSVTLWGMADDHTWLNMDGSNNAPFLFDKTLKSKYAYWALIDPATVPVYIQQQNIAKASPDIEDFNDKSWITSSAIKIKNVIKGESVPATMKALWDEEYLYILADISDKTYNDKDGVEIFVDRNNGKTDAYDSDDSHYTVNSNGVASENGKTSSIKTVSVNTANGYKLQIQIPLDEINPAEDMKIGFDIKVNDYIKESTASNVSVWNDIKNIMDTDTTNYGELTLGTSSKLAEAIVGTATIDGTIDDAWSSAAEYTTDEWVQGTSGAQAKVKFMWDENYVYILANVTDSNLDKSSSHEYEQDSVETFIDENNNKTSSYEVDDSQYRVNFDNEKSFSGGCDQDGFKSATKITESGYIVEEAIPLNAVSIEANRIIGLDIQVNDATDGARTAVSIWCDASGNSWKSTENFGNLILLGAEDEETPTETPAVSYNDKDLKINITAGENVVPVGAEFKITSLDISEKDKEAIKKENKDYEIVGLYDISLLLNNAEIQPNGELKLYIPVPEGMSGKKLGICRINDDGTIDIIPSQEKDGKLEFKLSHLSKYAVYVDNSKTSTKTNIETITKTGSALDFWSLLIIAMFALMSGCALIFKSKKTEGK
ncbi:MAG: endo-1,4-beta-xylanase [Clostridiaceae bacterium]